MNSEVKAQLIADLRSGEYQQAHGVLRDKGAYCCLGVLCEQARRSGVALTVIPHGYEEGAHHSVLVVPPGVRQWAGLSDYLQTRLIELNDRDRKSFNEIADYLEGLE